MRYYVAIVKAVSERGSFTHRNSREVLSSYPTLISLLYKLSQRTIRIIRLYKVLRVYW